MLQSWTSWTADQSFVSFWTRSWGWAMIAVLPLFFALFRFGKSMIPVGAALVFSIVLPWCSRTWTNYVHYPNYARSEVLSQPSLLSHALVAAFAVFLIWWGVRQTSRALVNLGVVYFALAVGWFYFSDIFDQVDRSLGLIGLGILFLAGGWALENTRRGLLRRMGQKDVLAEEAE
jgi:hypothetical protein